MVSRKFFIFKKKNERFKLNSMFTPPIISIILALTVVYLGLREFIPSAVLSPIMMIGQTSFVLSMIILGAWLARNKQNIKVNPALISKIVILKLIFIPILAFFAVIKWEMHSFLGLFLILEASMPSAASLPIVADLRGGNS